MAADFYFRLGMREVWSQLLGRYKIRKILLTKIIQGFLVPKIVYSKDRFWCRVFSFKVLFLYEVTVWSPKLSPKEYCNCILFFKQGFKALGILAYFVHIVYTCHIDLEGDCNKSIHTFVNLLTYFGFLFYRQIFRPYFPALSENDRSCCVSFLFNCVLLGKAIDFLLSCLWEIKAVKRRFINKALNEGERLQRIGFPWPQWDSVVSLPPWAVVYRGLAQQLCFPAMLARPACYSGRLLSHLLFADNFVCWEKNTAACQRWGSGQGLFFLLYCFSLFLFFF